MSALVSIQQVFESTTSTVHRWWLIASTAPSDADGPARTHRDRILRVGAMALTLMALANVVLRQDRITVADGAGWDGQSYVTMAETGDARLGGRFHGLRIGVPFLARHFVFSDTLSNFAAINLVCGVHTPSLRSRWSPVSWRGRACSPSSSDGRC